MNRRQLMSLGVPAGCVPAAIDAVRRAAESETMHGADLPQRVRQVVENPALYLGDPLFGQLAEQLAADPELGRQPIQYTVWGKDIDPNALRQMNEACRVPSVVGAALMPDAHVGYGLPIGGVLCSEGTVIPYAVGVDIACRMKLSILDLDPDDLRRRLESCSNAIQRGTRFGVGAQYDHPQNHPVMDADWTVSPVVRTNRDKAWRQLGTSGSGNHFVELGTLTIPQRDETLGLDPGCYTALLSHSGSRGVGAAVCSTYSQIARQQLPREHAALANLAWLDLISQAGQEYWRSMNLMGDYAAANHDVIHHSVVRHLGSQIVAGVENHHNFAWIENHGGRQVVVHRKGATPAGPGVMGIIPGSMGDPAFVVRGKGSPASFASASHGAGRRMSRTQAKSTYNFRDVQRQLAARGIHVISAGSDEVPGVYKNIHEVMDQQRDLVDVVARFDPKIVKMCGDGSRAED